MYKEDLALNNLQQLIWNKTKSNKNKPCVINTQTGEICFRLNFTNIDCRLVDRGGAVEYTDFFFAEW